MKGKNIPSNPVNDGSNSEIQASLELEKILIGKVNYCFHEMQKWEQSKAIADLSDFKELGLSQTGMLELNKTQEKINQVMNRVANKFGEIISCQQNKYYWSL